MNNQGLDYGLGKSNIDLATGIRYGVISQHSVGEAWYNNAKADYGAPNCPKCGNPVGRYEESEHSCFEPYTKWGCEDYACEHCEITLDSEQSYPDEPLGFSYSDHEYTLSDCLDSDIMVIRSPYYTFAQFCSPCVPGAGNLDHPIEGGVKTYCLGPEWFEEETAPYAVYRVEAQND